MLQNFRPESCIKTKPFFQPDHETHFMAANSLLMLHKLEQPFVMYTIIDEFSFISTNPYLPFLLYLTIQMHDIIPITAISNNAVLIF